MQSAVKRELDLMMVTCPEKPRSKYFPTASPIRSLMRARKASPTSMCFPDMRSVIRNCPFYPGLHCREFILVVRPHKLWDSLLAEFTQVPGDRSLPSPSVFRSGRPVDGSCFAGPPPAYGGGLLATSPPLVNET